MSLGTLALIYIYIYILRATPSAAGPYFFFELLTAELVGLAGPAGLAGLAGPAGLAGLKYRQHCLDSAVD